MADGGKGNAIMIAIGKAKKKPGFLGGGSKEPDGDEPDGDESSGSSEDETAAFKAFEDASSSEDKMTALKTFIKLCTEGY